MFKNNNGKCKFRTQTKLDVSLPRSIKLLDRIVSAYAPGGRAAWPEEKRRKASKAKKLCRPKIPSWIRAEHPHIQSLLMPRGKILDRRIAQNSLSLLLVIWDSFPQFFNQISLGGQLSLIQTMLDWPEKEIEKRCKNLFVWGFARLMKQELPAVHSIKECRQLGFQGRAARWLRNLFVCKRNPKNVKFFWAVLQGAKRACCQISEDFIEEAYEKHKKALTKPFPEISCDLQEAMRFGRSLFKGCLSVTDLPPPSFSASFRSKRSDGGKLAEISQNATQPFYGLAFENGNIERLRALEGCNISASDAANAYLQSVDRRQTRVQMVLEPLKARPITAGSALGSYASMKGQREMWNHLYKKPQCKLIGEPLSEDHLQWLDRKSPDEFTHWVSGDYSAATDNLDIRLTKQLFEQYLYHSSGSDELDETMRELLYEQDLHYPHDGSIIRQQNGQLMGSPLSFPILCAANLFGYHQAWKRYFGKSCKIHQLPVLVNGDDILFKANTSFYKIWQEEIKKIGFELSVGKSYFSKDFLTVNSKLYLLKKIQSNSHFELVSFFNPAQMLPVSYVRNDKETKLEEKAGFPSALMEDGPIAGRLSDLLDRASDSYRALQAFLYFNKGEIARATLNGKLNLFIAPELGGIGVKTSFQRFRISRFQRQLATACLHQQAKAVEARDSHSLRGYTSLVCRTSAVRASCEPDPKKLPQNPSKLGHRIVRSGEKIWKHMRNLQAFVEPYRKIKRHQLLSSYYLRTAIFTQEIVPCLENDLVLRLSQCMKSFEIPIGNWIAHEAVPQAA